MYFWCTESNDAVGVLGDQLGMYLRLTGWVTTALLLCEKYLSTSLYSKQNQTSVLYSYEKSMFFMRHMAARHFVIDRLICLLELIHFGSS